VDLFLSYLSNEEENEFKQNVRIKGSTEFKDSYLMRIKEYYEKEKLFILKRINENTEKHYKELEELEDSENEQIYEGESD
jgi:hypothetical protein